MGVFVVVIVLTVGAAGINLTFSKDKIIPIK